MRATGQLLIRLRQKGIDPLAFEGEGSWGLIVLAGLARLAGQLRCAEMTFSPVLHEASQLV